MGARLTEGFFAGMNPPIFLPVFPAEFPSSNVPGLSSGAFQAVSTRPSGELAAVVLGFGRAAIDESAVDAAGDGAPIEDRAGVKKKKGRLPLDGPSHLTPSKP